MFCLIYSGALSVVIWVNLVTRQRLEARMNSEPTPQRYNRGA
jgi:hypothetical protein